MVDFINEVEEELRKDKYNALLRKYGPYIVGLIIGVVVFAGVLEYRKSSSSKIGKRASASYVAAQKLEAAGDLQGAAQTYIRLADVAPPGYAGMSLSMASGINVQLGDLDGAAALFTKASDAYTAPRHKDLALYKAALILVEQGKHEQARSLIAPLINGDSPYQDLAKELEAHILYAAGDISGARAKFSYLVNAPGVLGGVKRRSAQTLSLINALPRETEMPAVPEIVAPEPAAPQSQNTAPQEEE